MPHLDKSKKTTQIFSVLRHRCSWPDYPSHQGSAGTETGQRVGDTGLLGHSRDCYGQPDPIHELTASVILERRKEEKGGCPKLPFCPHGLPHPTRNSSPNLFRINLIICSQVQKSQNSHSELRLSWHEPVCRGNWGINKQIGCWENASFKIVFYSVLQCY